MFRPNLLLVAAVLPVFVACSRPSHALAPAEQAGALSKVPASATVSSQATETYTLNKAEPINMIARKYLARTKYMTVAELETALRQENALPAKLLYVKPGTALRIPGIEPQPIVEQTRKDPADTEVRAIYLTGATAGSALGLKIVEHWHQVGGNAVVFDIKDSDGTTSIPFDHALAPHNRHNIDNLPKYVCWLHQHDMHAIARIALFRDEHIARTAHREAAEMLAAESDPDTDPVSKSGRRIQRWFSTYHRICRARPCNNFTSISLGPARPIRCRKACISASAFSPCRK